ncbi:9914_t:CDS:2 [Racocetra fulgida]|uniref:9914_t:CDS:1 n=1 Tax=Racocetra fulgida TaxID=60492 RepID=A0A9N9BWP4_9GLOM|nr:9914_t:CDS:2 [Racocetra fulgida]
MAFKIYSDLSGSKSEFQTLAKLYLAWLYLYGVGVDKDTNNAKDLFLELYYQTNPIYYKMAFQLYLDLSKSQSDQQNSAKYELALCYELGKGVKKDYDNAYELYLDLSKSEDYQIKAFRWLANYYLKKDEERSFKYSQEEYRNSLNRLDIG